MLQSIDSPYKNCLSKIKQIDQLKDDSDDFKTPIPIRRAGKCLPKPETNKCKKNTSIKLVKKNKSSILRTTKDNFENIDVNPDHLQMALALSKSTFETENPHCQSNNDLPDFKNNVKLVSVLERFGFKSNKTKMTSDKPKKTAVHEGSSGEVSAYSMICTNSLVTCIVEEQIR